MPGISSTRNPLHFSRAAERFCRLVFNGPRYLLASGSRTWMRSVSHGSSARLNTVNQDMLGFPKCSTASVPSFAAAAVSRYHAEIAKVKVKGEPIQPVFRGFRVQNAQDWRGVFFYRFVNPLSRTGRNLNYADRLRGADADLLVDARWAVFHSNITEARANRPIRFTLLGTNSD